MSRLPASISAVLPADNEVAVIADMVRRTHAALDAGGVARHEVVVVDDGSNGGTAERVLDLAAELPATRLLTHPSNRGYGTALRTGFDAARGEAVWLLDSDGQFDPADAVVARAFVELLGLRADRDANGSGNERAQGVLRRRR